MCMYQECLLFKWQYLGSNRVETAGKKIYDLGIDFQRNQGGDPINYGLSITFREEAELKKIKEKVGSEEVGR